VTLLVTVPSAELAESLRPLPDGVLDGTPLPSLGRVNETSPVSEISPTRAARARKAAASRRPATRNSQNAAEPAKPRPLAVQLLAAGLVQRIPWLDRSGAHIGHVCDLVDRLQLAQRGWTVQQILDRIELHAREHRIQIANPTDQRRPLHYLAWLLRRAITADEISPTVTVQLERDKRRQEAARRYAEEAARRAQIAAEAEEIQAIIDSMRLNRSTRTKRV